MILVLLDSILCLRSFSQITRGTSPGEIYLSLGMFWEELIVYNGVFRSINNGDNISLQYVSTYPSQPGEMEIRRVLGDATLGAIYNYGNDELWVSFNFGESWMLTESQGTDQRYTSGCLEGEIYKYCKNPTSKLYRSENHGEDFQEINDNVYGFVEVGTESGEIYILTGATYPLFYIKILYSDNYGETFDTIEVDSSIAGYNLSGHFPEISRGITEGELYLVSWHLPSNYHIYYSQDHGQTFVLKYTSDYINFYYWGVNFTAGREPGIFYVMRSRPDPSESHGLLYIDFSNDYGETFTTFFHDLGNWVGISPIHKNQNKTIQSFCYPNPFFKSVTINFKLPNQSGSTQMKIFDMNCNEIQKFNFSGIDKILWDATNQCGQKVNSGIYFYQIISGDLITPLNKIIYINPN